MSSFSIDISSAVVQRLKNLPAVFTTAAVEAVGMAAQRVLVFMTQRSRALKIADTGRFVRSWQVKEIADGTAIGGKRYEVYNDAPYAAVIEGGRRAGARMPPVDPIQRWAARKGIGDGSRSTAFAIARAIGRKGIKGKNVISDAKSQISKLAITTFRQSFTRKVRALRGK